MHTREGFYARLQRVLDLCLLGKPENLNLTLAQSLSEAPSIRTLLLGASDAVLRVRHSSSLRHQGVNYALGSLCFMDRGLQSWIMLRGLHAVWM